MKYRNGKDVLPPELLREVQKYACGELIYIPQKEEKRIPWGHLSGIREQVYHRNSEIIKQYRNGSTVSELIIEYCLSESSIRKIIYSNGTR